MSVLYKTCIDLQYSLTLVFAANTESESWEVWQQWGPCSHSCGTLGEQKRFRLCLTPQMCSAESYETRVCNYAKSCSDSDTLPNVFGKIIQMMAELGYNGAFAQI